MKALAMGFILLSIGLAISGLSFTALAADDKPEGIPRWEYRALTKEQVIDLGKKDLTAGLNRLGAEGWELIATDGAYIFKRPRIEPLKNPEDIVRKQADDIKGYIAIAERELEMWKDRVSWSERMVKRGYVSAQRLQAERLQMLKAEMALDKAQRDLQSLQPNPKVPPEKARKPEK